MPQSQPPEKKTYVVAPEGRAPTREEALEMGRVMFRRLSEDKKKHEAAQRGPTGPPSGEFGPVM